LRFDENIKRAFYDHYEFEQLLLLQLLEDAAFAVAAGIKSYMKSARIFCFDCSFSVPQLRAGALMLLMTISVRSLSTAHLL
jgi:hypothetical protein